MGDHHIPCLEVAIQEALLVAGLCQVLGQQAEVGLQLQLMEVELRSLEEAVLKVVQVEEHGVLVERRLGVAVREVELAGAPQLYVRQLADGLFQQRLLGQRVTASGLTTAPNGIEQRHRTEVRLQIAQFVVAHGQHLRHGQLTLREVTGQIDKRVVLVAARADAANDAVSVRVCQSVVLTVAAGPRQLLGGNRRCPTPLLI